MNLFIIKNYTLEFIMIFSFLRFKKESGRGEAGKNNADSKNNDDEIISGIPKYPPFLEGLPYATPEQLLKTQQELIDRLKLSCGISDAQYRELLEPMLKIMGIEVVTNLTGQICRDAGAGGVAAAAELAGAVCALYTAVPVIQAVLVLIKELL